MRFEYEQRYFRRHYTHPETGKPYVLWDWKGIATTLITAPLCALILAPVAAGLLGLLLVAWMAVSALVAG